MSAYVVRRLLLVPVSVLLLTIFVFGMVRAVPGNAVAAKLENNYSRDQATRLLKQYGLQEPAWKQYFVWLGNVAHGDFGESFITSRPISQDLKDKIPVSAELLVLVTLIQIPVGIGVGVVSAIWQNKPQDYVARLLSITLLAIPSFWLATLVVILPSLWWGWSLPAGYARLWDDPQRNLHKLLVPAVVAALSSAALLMRIARSQMLEVLRADYMRTAKAKGLPAYRVVLQHGLKNALIPIVTVIGLSVAAGFGSLVIMEQVFSIPGLGSYAVTALANRDYPAIEAVVVVVGVVFTVTNLIVDLSYTVLNPRIRYS